jgi:hypothetical protein
MASIHLHHFAVQSTCFGYRLLTQRKSYYVETQLILKISNYQESNDLCLHGSKKLG